eukprot:m51a1_g5501 Transport protein particle (TRAPP) component Trs130A (1587) ;mRNA; f:358810-364738
MDLDSSGGFIWEMLWPQLKARLPLQDVQWRTKVGATRSVPQLQVDFLPQGDPRITFPLDSMTNWHRLPYLRLFLVNGDDNEKYASAKKTAQHWIEGLSGTPTTGQWLVVVVTQRAPSKQIFQGSFLDKLRRDLNRKDRIVALRMDGGGEDLWIEFLAKVKEALTASFETFTGLLSDEIKLLDSQRQRPGWDFLNYFLIKEALAMTYERAQIPQSAVVQYNQLECTFVEHKASTGVFKEQWGMYLSESSTAMLIDAPRDKCRELITTHRISPFDFGQYLFSRQAAIYFSMMSPVFVASKASSFITQTHKDLCRMTPAPPFLFAETWTMTATLAVAQECLKHISTAPRIDPIRMSTASAPADGPGALQRCTSTVNMSSSASVAAGDTMSVLGIPVLHMRSRSTSGPKSTVDMPISGLGSSRSPFSHFSRGPTEAASVAGMPLGSAASSSRGPPSVCSVTREADREGEEVSMYYTLGNLLYFGRIQLERMGLAFGLYEARMQNQMTAFADAYASVLDEIRLAVPESLVPRTPEPVLEAAPRPTPRAVARAVVEELEEVDPAVADPVVDEEAAVRAEVKRHPALLSISSESAIARAGSAFALGESTSTSPVHRVGSASPAISEGGLGLSDDVEAVPPAPHSTTPPSGEEVAPGSRAIRSRPPAAGGNKRPLRIANLNRDTPGRKSSAGECSSDRPDAHRLQLGGRQRASANIGVLPPMFWRHDSASLAERGAGALSETASKELLASIKSETVREALSSQENFDKQYVAMTEQAQCSYNLSNRGRVVERLTRDIAFLFFKRRRWLDAADSLELVLKQFEANQWTEMAYRVQAMLARSYRALEHWTDYAESCMYLLNPALPLSALERVYYTQQLFDAVPSCLNSRHVLPMDLVFKLTLGGDALTAESYTIGDAVTLKCTVESNLAVPVQVQNVSVRLARSNMITDDQVLVLHTPEGNETVTISPGTNEYTLCTTPAILGDFHFHRFIVEKGGLALEMDLEPLHLKTVTVKPSVQTAELVTLLPLWLPVGGDSAKEATLVIKANEDVITEGTVTITSRTELEVSGGRQYMLFEVRDADGNVKLSQEQKMSVTTLKMLPLARNETCSLKLFIPPQPVHTTHQVSFGLNYVKSTRERLSLRKDLSIEFTLPFKLCHWVVPLGENTAAAQISATNSALSPLTITDYSLSAGGKAAEDIDSARASIGATVHQSHQLSLAFVLSHDLRGAEQKIQTCELRVSYKYPNATRTETAEFVAQLPLHLHSHDYEVAYTAVPDAVVVGNTYDMTFTLARTHGQGEDRVTYEVRFNQELWMIAGFKRQAATLVDCTPSTFTVRVVPLVVGRLPMPEVVLLRAVPARVGQVGWKSVCSFPDSEELVCSFVEETADSFKTPISPEQIRGEERDAEVILCWIDDKIDLPAMQYLVDNVQRQRPRTLIKEMTSSTQLSRWLDHQTSAIAAKLRVVTNRFRANDGENRAAYKVVSLLRQRSSFADTPVMVFARSSAGLEDLSQLPRVQVTTELSEILKFASPRAAAVRQLVASSANEDGAIVRAGPSTSCHRCKQSIPDKNVVVTEDGSVMHHDCYSCGVCGQCLAPHS